MPPVPLPSSGLTTLLVAFLPGLATLGWFAASRATRTKLLATVLAPGFALASWIYATHLIGYLTRSFAAAMWVATIGLGAAGYALVYRRPPNRRVLSRLWRFRDTRWMVLTSLAMTGLIAPLALGRSFHDEGGVHGHLAMASSIQNGYPPADLGFPQLELRYHYGYDLACAMVGSMLRISVSASGDWITIASWFYVCVLGWTIGRRLVGRWGGPATALALLYGAGVPFNCPEQIKAVGRGAQLCGFCSFGGTVLNPPLVSYHFQHPWTVGLPIALVLLIVFDRAPRARDRWIAIGWLQAALAMSQIVLFASLAAALPVAELARKPTQRVRSALLTALAVGVAVLVASRTGGFFTPWPSGHGLEIRAGIGNSFAGSITWVVRGFGLLLVGGVAGHFVTRRPQIVWALLALGGLAVINVVHYKLTADIVKFATVATVGLAIPSGALVGRALAARALPLKGAGVLALVGLVASSAGWHAALLFDMKGVPPMYMRAPPPITPDDARAADWLRQNMPRDAVMFRNKQGFIGYAVWGGLPQAFFDERHMSGVKLSVDRAALLKRPPRQPAPYLEQHIRFFVLDATDRVMTVNVEAWIKDGIAVERAKFGALRIVELIGAR